MRNLTFIEAYALSEALKKETDLIQTMIATSGIAKYWESRLEDCNKLLELLDNNCLVVEPDYKGFPTHVQCACYDCLHKDTTVVCTTVLEPSCEHNRWEKLKGVITCIDCGKEETAWFG